jgi:hypothetical protein
VASASIVAPDLVVITNAPRLGWAYPTVMQPLLLALAAAGVVVMTRRRWARPAAVVAAVLATQAACAGLATIHRFFTFMGLGGFDRERHNLVALHAYAAVVVIAATAAAVTAVALAWREPANGWRGLVPARPWYVAAGLVVAVALPSLWDPPGGHTDLHGFAHMVAVPYALPWGLALAAVGWLRGRTARAAGLTVVVSAIACAVIAVGSYWYVIHLTPRGD